MSGKPIAITIVHIYNTLTILIDRDVKPHSSATLSLKGFWQEASLKSVPSNNVFDLTSSICLSRADNFPPT